MPGGFGADPHTFVPPITPALMRAAVERKISYLRTELVMKRASVWRRRAVYRRYAALTARRILYTLVTGGVAPKRTAREVVYLVCGRRRPQLQAETVRRRVQWPVQLRT